MTDISDERFEDLIHQALASLPGEHVKNIENVAILQADEPTPEQRVQLELRHDQLLLGLYEGVPLAFRQGQTKLLPDTITLFKFPLCAIAGDEEDLRKQTRHTIWHEIAHYYGLNHDQIHSLE